MNEAIARRILVFQKQLTDIKSNLPTSENVELIEKIEFELKELVTQAEKTKRKK